MRQLLLQLHEFLACDRNRYRGYILRRYDSPAFRQLLFVALSPTVNLGVGYPDFNLDPGTTVESNTLLEFTELVNKLRRKELPWLEAKVAVLNYVQSFPPSFRETMAEILTQNLPLRVSSWEINRFIGAAVIPPACMHPVLKFNEAKIKYPVYASRACVGPRYLCFVEPDGFVSLRTLKGQTDDLVRTHGIMSSLPPAVYEFELLHTEHLQEYHEHSRRQCSKLFRADEGDIYIHDVIPWDDWGLWKMGTGERAKLLERLELTHPNMFKVPYYKVENNIQLADCHELFLSQGYIRTEVIPSGPYNKDAYYLS